jgi:hypothetical protein
MATIELKLDNASSGIAWLVWEERNEIVGKVLIQANGRCRVLVQGPFWSPMKSLAGKTFTDRQSALAEVQLYFQGR